MEKNFPYLFGSQGGVNIYLDKQPQEPKPVDLEAMIELQNTYVWDFVLRISIISVCYIMYLHVDSYLKVRAETEIEKTFIEDYQFFLSQYSTLETLRKIVPKILMFLLNQSLFRFGKEIYNRFKKKEKVEE